MTDDVITAAAHSRLRSIVERIERLEEDKAAVANDIKEVFAEAKGEGFDVKILRKVVRIRKQDKAKRQEEEALLDLYLSAIGEAPARSPAARLQSLAAADETRISIEFPGRAPIHTTASALDVALAEVTPPARKPRAKRSGGGAGVQWHDDRPPPDADDGAQVYRSGPRRGRR